MIVSFRDDANGKLHYVLSMDDIASSGAADRVTEARGGQPDDNGAEVLQGGNPANPTVELKSSTSAVEGDPSDLNLDFAPSEGKADAGVTDDDLRVMTSALDANPKVRALAGMVTVKAVRRLVSQDDNMYIKSVYRKIAATVLDGRPAVVKITVKENVQPNEGNRIYTVEGIDVSESGSASKWLAAASEADGVDLISNLYAEPLGSMLSLLDKGKTSGNIEMRRGGEMEMHAFTGTVRAKFVPLVAFGNWRNPSEWTSGFLIDRMV